MGYVDEAGVKAGLARRHEVQCELAGAGITVSGAVTSFSEPGSNAEGKSKPAWFALDEARPLAFFAGIHTNWTCTRKLAEGEITCDLFAFLTTDPNAEVDALHPKAMPVILTAPGEYKQWLTAPWPEAATLQRPLPEGALTIVARGAKSDDEWS